MLSHVLAARLGLTRRNHGNGEGTDGHCHKTDRMSPHQNLPGSASWSAIGALSIWIVVDRRRPHLAMEAPRGARADIARLAPGRSREARLFGSPGTSQRIVPAKVCLLVMLSNMPAAR